MNLPTLTDCAEGIILCNELHSYITYLHKNKVNTRDHKTPVTKHDFALASEINPLNAELNPICYLLALLGAHHFLHVSRIRVKSLTLRLLMSYIYI